MSLPTRLAAGALVLAALAGCATSADNGLVSVRSPHSAADTMSRLEAQVRQRNLAVVAKVDHAAGATRAGLSLRPTELLIFGNPMGGTPLMQCAQGAGIDLPLKALVWVDAGQQVWLGYNDPLWLARRHGAPDCAAAANLRKALDGIAQATVAP